MLPRRKERTGWRQGSTGFNRAARQGEISSHLMAVPGAVRLRRMRAPSRTLQSFRVRSIGVSCSSVALGVEPKQDRCEDKNRKEVPGALLLARSHSAVLLEATDQPLPSVAFPMFSPVFSADVLPKLLARLPDAPPCVADDNYGSISEPLTKKCPLIVGIRNSAPSSVSATCSLVSERTVDAPHHPAEAVDRVGPQRRSLGARAVHPATPEHS